MSTGDGLFTIISSDKKYIEKRLEMGDVLCMILNKKSHSKKFIDKINGFGYILGVEYKGDEYLAIAGGCYKKQPKRFDRPDPVTINNCSKAKQFTHNGLAIHMYKGRMEDPLCIVLQNSLTDEQVNFIKVMYETIEVEYEGEKHTAIACAFYDPEYVKEGKVIAQWTEMSRGVNNAI